MDSFYILMTDCKKNVKLGKYNLRTSFFSANWNHHHYLTLNENNINVSVITESKKKLKGTKETENYMVIYSGFNRYTTSQLGVMIWFYNSISNKIEYYKFWNGRTIEIRLKYTEDI